jgi:ABC-type multidrug transport system fused ATPase/permease subunit
LNASYASATAAAPSLSLCLHPPSPLTPLFSYHAVEVVGSEVVFRNVSFAYPLRHGQPVLKQVDLHIKPGQRIAIVGCESHIHIFQYYIYV